MGRGITNNAVEFLVQLGIDEEKSKKSIDKYLEKISNKTIKLTYSVNVGVSDKNISEYLKKHNGKVLKVDFDVNRQTSNKNFKTYLDTQKEQKGSMFFEVDKKKTERNIKLAIEAIKVQNIIAEVVVDKRKSQTNVNTFLTSLKLGKKHVEIDVLKQKSKDNINTYLTTMNLKKISVALSLAKNGLSDIKEGAKGTVIKGIKGVLELDVQATKLRIAEQINKMKIPKFKVDVIANVVPSISKNAQLELERKVATPAKTTKEQNAEAITANKAKDGAGLNLNGYVGTIKEVKKQIQKDLAEAGKSVHIFEGDILKAQQKFIQQLEKDGAKITTVRDAQTKEITKITATTRNSANEVISTVYKPMVATYDNLNKKIKDGSKEVRGFVAETDKIDNKEVFDMDKAIANITKKLEQAKHKGHLFGNELERIQTALKKAGNNNDLDKINKDLDSSIIKAKNKIEVEKLQNNIFKQREQILSNITRTEKLYRRTHDKDVANELKSSVNMQTQDSIYGNKDKGIKAMDIKALREYSTQLAITQTQVSKFHAQATEATKNSMGIINSLKVAMEKFPIWMVASTAFFGTVRTLREFGSIIIDVDKKMTDLKKVMSEDTDFDKIFEQATVSAETFGKTISETLDAYNMFAKQGYKGEDLQTLASAGLVAGNVGDIEAGKASEYLTASLLQWNKESSEAMGVVDSWNEISNNYATTVENLAQGQAKAGATAKALGMDFNQLNAVVGTLNARTKQSGNEIGNFVKSTFSNLVSAKGKKTLDGLGVSLEDENGNMRDVMEIYKDVAKEYVNLNQADKNSVTLGLAGKYHISRMQTLLDTLGETDNMYDRMYETAKNSSNSAMDENQKYMQSLEARINLARVEVEKLALAIGEAFMTESMITGLQLFGKILSSLVTIVETVGALPTAMLGFVAVLALVSNRFNDILKKAPKMKEMASSVTGMFNKEARDTSPTPSNNNNNSNDERPTRVIESNSRATDDNEKKKSKLNRTVSQSQVLYRGQLESVERVTRSTDNDTKATERNTNAKKKGAGVMSLFTAGFGLWGAGAIAVGFALERLLGHISKVRQESEDLKNSQVQEIAMFKTNESAITKLSSRYKELSSIDLDPKSEGYTELLETQNELAKLLPSLKLGEDEYGNAILQNSTIVSGRIDLLKEQIRLEEELSDAKATQENEEVLEEAEKTYKKQKGKRDDGIQDAQSTINNTNFIGVASKAGVYAGQVDGVKDLINAINTLDTKVKDQKFFGELSKTEQTSLKMLRKELYNTYTEVNGASLAMGSSLNVVRSSAEKDLNDILQSTEKLSDGAVEGFSNIVNSAISFADTSSSIKDISDAFSGIQIDSSMQDAFNSFGSFSDKLKNETNLDLVEVRTEYEKTFDEIAKTILESSKKDPDSKAYKSIKKALDNAKSSAFDYRKEVSKVAKEQGLSIKDAEAYVAKYNDTGEAVEGASSALEEYANNLRKYSTLEEERLYYTQASYDETKSLINTYESLINVTDRTTDEQLMLEDAMERLTALYPHLVSSSDFRIEALYNEQNASKVLLEANKNLTEGMLTEEETRTYNSTVNTNARIRDIQREMMAMEDVYNSYKSASDKIMEKSKNGEELSEGEYKALMRASYTIVDFETKATELDKYLVAVDGNLGKLSSANERVASTTKSSSKETDEAKNISDKYALSLEKINTQLDEINSKKEKYATHTANYRKAIEEENELIQQQINLGKQQAKELGAVASSSSSISGTSSSTSVLQPSGFQGAITSGYGAKESFRKKPHTGIDIAGARGTKLESNVGGKVVDRGSNSVSGNYVTVLDNNGMRHFYAHLDSIAVAINDVAKVGTKLGTIGNTGNVVTSGDKSKGAGSHLHYEVKDTSTNKNVDPTRYVNSAKGGVTYNVTVNTGKASTGNSSKDSIWNYFKGKGLDDNAVSGIMGNLQQESNFNSNAGKNASGSAYGLAQWRGGRREGLNSYASSLGKSASDLQVQLDYIWKELNSTEKSTLNSLQTSKSVADHTSSFNSLFERSGEKAGDKGYNNRLSYASSASSAYSGVAYNPSISGGASEDESQQKIEELKQSNLDFSEKIEENKYAIIQSYLEEYEYHRKLEDDIIASQEIRKGNLQSYTDAYEDSVNKQHSAEGRKTKLYEDELKYVNQLLNSGKLNENQQYEQLARQAELTQAIQESAIAQKGYYSEVVQGRLDRFDRSNQQQQDILDWEAVKIKTVDKESVRYIKTLEIMNRAKSKQRENIVAEQKYVDKMLKSGKLTSSMYQELTERAKSLKIEAIESLIAIRETNMEIIQTGVSLSNEKIDDLDFNIERSQSIRSLYDEDSGDALREMNYELEQNKIKLEEIKKLGDNIRSQMKSLDLGHEQLEQLEEQLEDNTLAWYATKNAIQDTEDSIKKFNESIDKEIKDKRKSLADDIIDALKEAYEELRDIRIDAIEEEIKVEEKRHEKVMNQYEDELDMFNDIIDAQRRKLNDADRDRSHEMTMDELTKERQKLQDKVNLLSNAKNYADVKERERLEEEIAEITKQINEEEYQYGKELLEQELDDALEKRTNHINNLQFLEDENHQKELQTLNEKKVYWNKYYDDLVNNERRFAEIRKNLMSEDKALVEQTLNEIGIEIDKHIEELKASLPHLQDSFHNTLEAVGANIRDKVIFRLEELRTKIAEVNQEIAELENKKISISNEFGNSLDLRDDNTEFTTDKDKEKGLTENDLKVLLAKFAREKIVESLNPKESASRIANIKEKTDKLASDARSGENGSTISSSASYDDIISSFSSNQVKQVGEYFKNNVSKLGLSTKEYNDYVNEYGSNVYRKPAYLSEGDKQVLLAKYMKEYLKTQTSNKSTISAIDSTAEKIANSGRNNTSLIVPTIGYDKAVQGLGSEQLYELGQYMKSNSSVIADGTLRSSLEEYAENMIISNNRQYNAVGLDTGGMTGSWGSNGGVDGKGGKYAVLHQREVVLNPLDTERMFKISSIMENIMRSVNGAVKLPSVSKGDSGNGTNDNSTTVHINIEKMNGTQSDIDNLSKQIQNRLLREKGKR